MKLTELLVKNTNQFYWIITLLVGIAYLGPISESYDMQNRCINAHINETFENRIKEDSRWLKENWAYAYGIGRSACD